MSISYFSPDYKTARGRFLAAARQSKAKLSSYALESTHQSVAGEPLHVDVAEVGSGPRLVVVSSGLHGVEGFFGSAVQLALLDNAGTAKLPCRLLLIHAINPWGFHHLRRTDQNNVDLNRNFRRDIYSGAPDGYHRLNRFLNPSELPSKFDAFRLRAALKIVRHGMTSLKESVASGQYEYPQGLFYGGSQLSISSQIIIENVRRWIADAEQVLHVDLHTGLGGYGRLSLLCNQNESDEHLDWFRRTFGAGSVETLGDNDGSAYPVEGQLGQWLQSEFSHIDYRFVGAEYGTYSPLVVLGALRAENRFYFYGDQQSAGYKQASQRLFECFCPADHHWREKVLASAVSVVQQGALAI